MSRRTSVKNLESCVPAMKKEPSQISTSTKTMNTNVPSLSRLNISAPGNESADDGMSTNYAQPSAPPQYTLPQPLYQMPPLMPLFAPLPQAPAPLPQVPPPPPPPPPTRYPDFGNYSVTPSQLPPDFRPAYANETNKSLKRTLSTDDSNQFVKKFNLALPQKHDYRSTNPPNRNVFPMATTTSHESQYNNNKILATIYGQSNTLQENAEMLKSFIENGGGVDPAHLQTTLQLLKRAQDQIMEVVKLGTLSYNQAQDFDQMYFKHAEMVKYFSNINKRMQEKEKVREEQMKKEARRQAEKQRAHEAQMKREAQKQAERERLQNRKELMEEAAAEKHNNIQKKITEIMDPVRLELKKCQDLQQQLSNETRAFFLENQADAYKLADSLMQSISESQEARLASFGKQTYYGQFPTAFVNEIKEAREFHKSYNTFLRNKLKDLNEQEKLSEKQRLQEPLDMALQTRFNSFEDHITALQNVVLLVNSELENNYGNKSFANQIKMQAITKLIEVTLGFYIDDLNKAINYNAEPVGKLPFLTYSISKAERAFEELEGWCSKEHIQRSEQKNIFDLTMSKAKEMYDTIKKEEEDKIRECATVEEGLTTLRDAILTMGKYAQQLNQQLNECDQINRQDWFLRTIAIAEKTQQEMLEDLDKLYSDASSKPYDNPQNVWQQLNSSNDIANSDDESESEGEETQEDRDFIVDDDEEEEEEEMSPEMREFRLLVGKKNRSEEEKKRLFELGEDTSWGEPSNSASRWSIVKELSGA